MTIFRECLTHVSVNSLMLMTCTLIFHPKLWLKVQMTNDRFVHAELNYTSAEALRFLKGIIAVSFLSYMVIKKLLCTANCFSHHGKKASWKCVCVPGKGGSNVFRSKHRATHSVSHFSLIECQSPPERFEISSSVWRWD